VSEKVFGVDLEVEDNGSDLGGVGDDFSYEDFVSANVGDGKKYKTPEEALVALAKKAAHADTFIETLKIEKRGVETEKERIAAELAQAKKLDDLMAILTQGDGTQPAAQPTAQPTGASAVTQEQLQQMLKDMLVAERQAEETNQQLAVQKANRDKAWESVCKAFGGEDGAKRALKAYIGTDPARRDIIDRMGAFQPDTVVDFLKLQHKQGKMPGVEGSSFVVTENYDLHAGQLTWAKVQDVKKNDPKLYKSRKFQLQIHQAAATNPNFWK
jgi:hypothetical protein